LLSQGLLPQQVSRAAAKLLNHVCALAHVELKGAELPSVHYSPQPHQRWSGDGHCQRSMSLKPCMAIEVHCDWNPPTAPIQYICLLPRHLFLYVFVAGSHNQSVASIAVNIWGCCCWCCLQGRWWSHRYWESQQRVRQLAAFLAPLVHQSVFRVNCKGSRGRCVRAVAGFAGQMIESNVIWVAADP
jgi:hypothetical protein